MNDRSELVILPPLKGQRGPNGGIVLTRKYIEGVAEYARLWSGPVTSLISLNETPSTDMDHIEVFADDPVSPLEERPGSDAALAARLEKAAVVLAFLASSEATLGAVCARVGVPLVFYTEYSPATERQIIDAETANPILRLRRKLWVRGASRTRLAMLRGAAGLQCNGVPVFRFYGPELADPLLYFDNRVRAADVISDEGLGARTAVLRQGQPLRLVFGGRLIAMKGAQHMPYIARELVRLGVKFQLDIYGRGPLEAELRRDIDAFGLSGCVALKGVLDFNTGWVPLLKTRTDLFICPHPQGDPSSTYTEVMSCGVPIVGYDNEAFLGVTELSGSGWPVQMGNQRALAERVAQLDRDREAMSRAGQRGRDFARDHCFEKTFERRVEHLRRIVRDHCAESAA